MPLSTRRRVVVACACLVPLAAVLAVVLARGGGGGGVPVAAPPAGLAPVTAPSGVAGSAPAPAARPRAAATPARLAPAPGHPLPAWLAPGAPLSFSGLAAPRVRVTLLVGGRRAGVARSGLHGAFTVNGRVPALAVGTYRVELAAGSRRVGAGALRVRPVELAAVGDVTFGDGVGWRIARTSSRYPWLRSAPLLRRADITTANLEGAVTERGTAAPGKRFHFRGPATSVRAAVRFAGIDVFALANNHSRDYGAVGLLDTVRAVRAAGAETIGGGADLAAARTPVIRRAGGLRVAFLGYNDVPPWAFTARRSRPGTAPAVPADIARDVRVARSRADLVVVWFHWGAELQTEPSARQQELARTATDAGATLVLGAHAHVLLPVESPAPGKLVAWGLGNFVFSAHSAATARTGVLVVKLSARGVVGHRLWPARIVAEQPRPLEG